MKILLYTCIVIDALQARKPFDISAQKIFKAAAENKIMDYIVTRNIKDYSKSKVPVLSPDEFLKLV